MNWLWWIVLGIVLGVAAMAPIMRIMLRRAEHRARLAERRARDAERLAELGSMTGGLAHEIKNPLSTIVARDRSPADDPDRLPSVRGAGEAGAGAA